MLLSLTVLALELLTARGRRPSDVGLPRGVAPRGELVLVALLLHVETVRLPRPAVRGVMHLANAAFPIYLLHRLVPEHLMPGLGLNLPPVAENTIAILGGLALGLLAARGLDWLTHLRWAPGLGAQEEPGFRLGQDPGPVSKAT